MSTRLTKYFLYCTGCIMYFKLTTSDFFPLLFLSGFDCNDDQFISRSPKTLILGLFFSAQVAGDAVFLHEALLVLYKKTYMYLTVSKICSHTLLECFITVTHSKMKYL